MMLKLLGSVGVIIGSFVVGNKLSESLKKRRDFLLEFNHDIILLKSRISEREKLSRAFLYVSKFSGYPHIWESFMKLSESNGVKFAIEETMNVFSDELCLLKNDVKTINMLAKGLGATDISAQKDHIDYVSGMINMSAAEAGHIYERDSKIYRSVAVFVGIVLVILLL